MGQLERFERCKTPMGTVPISVIMGFDYPLDLHGGGGRGEATIYGEHTNNYATRYNTGTNYLPATGHKSYNTDYMDINKLARLPRSGGAQTWPSSLNAQSTYSTYRTQNQSLERGRSTERTFRFGETREHPKQEPCRYATALAGASRDLTQPRQARARTVIPSSPSPWRRTASASRWSSSSSSYGRTRLTTSRFY